jgi:hypothetical protein
MDGEVSLCHFLAVAKSLNLSAMIHLQVTREFQPCFLLKFVVKNKFLFCSVGNKTKGLVFGRNVPYHQATIPA